MITQRPAINHVYRVRDCGVLSPNEVFISQPSSQDLEDLCGKGVIAKVRGTLSEPAVVAGTVSSGHKMFELTETLAAHAGQARVRTNSIPAWRRGSRHEVLPLTEKLFTTDAFWERENLSPMQCHTPVQVPCLGVFGQHKMDFMFLLLFF